MLAGPSTSREGARRGSQGPSGKACRALDRGSGASPPAPRQQPSTPGGQAAAGTADPALGNKTRKSLLGLGGGGSDSSGKKWARKSRRLELRTTESMYGQNHYSIAK